MDSFKKITQRDGCLRILEIGIQFGDKTTLHAIKFKKSALVTYAAAKNLCKHSTNNTDDSEKGLSQPIVLVGSATYETLLVKIELEKSTRPKAWTLAFSQKDFKGRAIHFGLEIDRLRK